MSLISGYMPHLPPTPKPVGGPVPDRSVRKEIAPVHVGEREPNREKRRDAIARRRAS